MSDLVWIEQEREIDKLKKENKELKNSLKKVQELGYNQDCLFCGFKDKAAKEALGGGGSNGQ